MSTQQQHLDELAGIRTRREHIEQATTDLDGIQYGAVLDARLAGVSWAKIGDALGVSAQAVQQRYAPTSKRP